MTTTIPSPTVGVYDLGPFPIRMYALCILAGIVLAVWLTGRRLVPRGGEPGQALDVAAYAVLFGIVGGRLYHVITTPEPYWGKGGHPLDALKIWQGGLGIWGAVALGALGAWIGCRRSGIPFLPFADAAAPGVAFAQALGRWGNWFNNELYGGPTDLPWGLQIHEWDQSAGRAVLDSAGNPVVLGVFHPTFLYESIFLVVLGVVLLVLDRRRTLAAGQLFGLYVAGYPIGRIVIEKMRTDRAELIWGQRLNVWTSIVVFCLGVWIFWYAGRRARRTEQAEPADGPHGPDLPDGSLVGEGDEPTKPTSHDVG
ncbi:MAG: prolipoprotein diacylglyceryl transferase [Ornithinibacter sp.]